MSSEFNFFQPRAEGASLVKSTLTKRAIGAVVTAIEDAWSQIETFRYQKSTPFSPSDLHDEDKLTTKLAEILNHRLDNQPLGYFSGDRFQTIVRDGKQTTANKSSIDQMPDLTVRMMKAAPGESRDEAALFVEAKLVDNNSGCSQYVLNGLHRFVAGKYAPQMSVGLMLGYCTANYAEVHIQLPNYFKKAKSAEAQRCAALLLPSKAHKACYDSEHTRDHPCAPDFRAMHLWLVRPLPTSGVPMPIAPTPPEDDVAIQSYRAKVAES